MSGETPPNRQTKRGVRQSLRAGIRKVKDAVLCSSDSRPPAEQTELLSITNTPAATLSRSRPTTPAVDPEPVVSQPDRHPVAPPAAPVSKAAENVGNDSTVTEEEEPSNIVWSRLANSLHLLKDVAGLFPPLKSAVSVLIGNLDVVRSAASNREDYNELVKEFEEFQSMIDILRRHAGSLKSESNSGSIAYIAQCIQHQIVGITQKGEHGTIRRLAEASQDREDILQRYRHVDRLFRQLQCDLLMRTSDNVEIHIETTLLRGMIPIDDARYNSGYSMTIKRRGCTAETREAIHKTLQEWTTNAKSQKIYWMNGMAGTGKTTIAYSYCEWLEATNRLGASFFCSRISSTCRSLTRIVPTLAYQLARYSSAFRSRLCTALKDNPDAGTLNVMQQFEKLINQPMLDAKDAMPDGVVVVIDALDECDDLHSVRMLLNVLLKFAEGLPLKFFVSSRPEHAIRDRMVSEGGAPRAIVHLHDIEQSIVEEDIKKYLTEALSSMTPSPQPKQIELLAKRSRNLFIYAATVVRYIYPEDVHVNSSARLDSMIAAISDPKAMTENRYDDLDRLYTTVLSAVFHARLNRSEKGSMQTVLWTIVCAKEPMTVATIASLASVEEQQVWASLQSLRSVVHVPEDNSLISTLHASFPEYMLDRSRSGEFHCDESQSHERLVYSLFDIMQSELRFNICGLNSSFLTDDQVEDLETRVTECISPTLSYACRYWGGHILFVPPSASTSERIVDFLSSRLLFWMEVLSLGRCIGIGAPMMQQVQTWLRQLVDTPDEIQKRVSDARNFVTWFAANPCSRSTPHIYISALPLCVQSNWVYQHYSRRAQGLSNISISQRNEALLAVWSLGVSLFSVAVSPNGSQIVVGCGDGSIQLFDTHTGALSMEPFKAHTRKVQSVAFSPDGAHIASGSDDCTVIIWDAYTGRIVAGPLSGRNGSVRSVAFSPDGNQLVSGSSDGTAIVWNTHSGDKVIGPLQGHTSSIRSVTFSPDGRLIASGSFDTTIRLWESNTGTSVKEPFKGHTDPINMVAFSPDGSQLASCSDDKTIRLWDVQTGTPVGIPLEGHKQWVRSLAFSDDGAHIVSGSYGSNSTTTTIIVWDTRTSSAVYGPLRGHTDTIRSVAFLPNGTHIVSCSGDTTIRIWDVKTEKTTLDKSTSHEMSIGPVAFAPDRTQFISNSRSGTLQLWDIHTGAPISRTFEEQKEQGPIRSLAFSSRGTYVAASSNDFAIRVWNTLTGVMNPHTLVGHTAPVICLAFSPNSSHLCASSEDSTVLVWDIQTGAIVSRPYNGHTGSVRSISYSPDDIHVVFGAADNTVQLWGTHTGTLVHTLSGHEGPIESLAFSLDGRYVVSGSADKSIRRWEVDATSDPVEYRCSDAVSSIAYSPDGGRVVAGFGSTIQIFNAQITEVVSELSLPTNEMVRGVEFSLDGKHIFSVSISKDKKEDVEDTETEDSESEQAGAATTQELLQNEPPNVIRVWRPDIRVDEGGRSRASDDLSMASDDSSMTLGNWTYNPDGRILSPDGLVMWVSPDLIPYLKKYAVSDRSPYVWSSDGVIDVGYKDLCIGERWAECYMHKN